MKKIKKVDWVILIGTFLLILFLSVQITVSASHANKSNKASSQIEAVRS